MKVREAKRLCSLNPTCAGITFPLQEEKGQQTALILEETLVHAHLKTSADKVVVAVR
jgi:hypothetical protein